MKHALKALIPLLLIFTVVLFAGCNRLKLSEEISIVSCVYSDTSEISPEDFVSGQTEGITVTFRKEPNMTKSGSQTVKLLLQSGEKELKVTSELYLFHINESTDVEKGGSGTVKISDFIADENVQALFVNSKTEYSVPTDECGKVAISLICDCIHYSVNVNVVDTTAPTASPKQNFTVYRRLGDEPLNFVTDIKDASQVNAKFKEEPDFSELGDYTAEIILIDEYSNSSSVEVNYSVVEDDVPPEFSGLDDITILVNGTASYKTGVTVTDNVDGEITDFKVDASAVNNRKTGTYTVKYTATDSTGNTATAERSVIVNGIDADKIDVYCDAVMKKIINDSMSVDEKIKAIWKWSKNNISFVGTSDKTDELHGAYQGFKSHAGDCYTYYAVNKYMLDKLGIENKTVRRIDGTSNHWWNLVKFSDGKWYFMDSCPLPSIISYATVFKCTASDLQKLTKAASATRVNYYKYDTSLYTDIDLAQ